MLGGLEVAQKGIGLHHGGPEAEIWWKRMRAQKEQIRRRNRGGLKDISWTVAEKGGGVKAGGGRDGV